MSQPQTRLETLARRVQTIITAATGEDAPITRSEAYEQVVEEMELAGFGAAKLSHDRSADAVGEGARESAH